MAPDPLDGAGRFRVFWTGHPGNLQRILQDASDAGAAQLQLFDWREGWVVVARFHPDAPDDVIADLDDEHATRWLHEGGSP